MLIVLEFLPPCDAARTMEIVDITEAQHVSREFRLAEGATIRGRVTDARSGAGIAGAEIQEGSGKDKRSVQTNALGEYTFCGFGENYSDLSVHAPGYGEQQALVRDWPNPSVHLQVDFALLPARTIRGRLVDPVGVPIADAYVAVAGHEFRAKSEGQQHQWASTRSAADGTFTIEGVRRDLQLGLVLAKSGYGTSVFELDPLRPPSDVEDLGDVELSVGTIVAGELVDERDTPIPGWPIQLSGWNSDRSRYFPLTAEGLPPRSDAPDTWFTKSDGTLVNLRPLLERYVDFLSRRAGQRTGRTDDLGRFSFADVAPGEYRVQAKEPGKDERGWASAAVVVESGGIPARIRLVRSTGLKIAGCVLDPDGRAVANAWVLLTPDPGGSVQVSSVFVRSDASGRFRFDAVAPGMHRLTIDVDAPGPNSLDPRQFAQTILRQVPAGSMEVDVRLPWGAFLVGRVVDATGSPVAHESIAAFDGGGVRRMGANTGPDGAFRLLVAAGETYDVVVEWLPTDPTEMAAALAAGERKLVVPNVAPGGPELELKLP